MGESALAPEGGAGCGSVVGGRRFAEDEELDEEEDYEREYELTGQEALEEGRA